MESFRTVSGIAVPMLRINIDTDQITPGKELVRVHKEGHAAPDLAADKPRPDGSARAPYDFRPDPTASVPADEREALRPASVN